MIVQQPKYYKRKHGSVVKVTIEMDFTQYNRFVTVLENTGMNKRDAVIMAINYWMNSLPASVRGE